MLALDDDLSLLCSIVVWLDVDMPVVGGFGALGLRVTHLCPKCNSHREALMPNVIQSLSFTEVVCKCMLGLVKQYPTMND